MGISTGTLYLNIFEIRFVDLVDSFHCDNVGICWDFGHAHLMGLDQREALRYMGKMTTLCLSREQSTGERFFLYCLKLITRVT